MVQPTMPGNENYTKENRCVICCESCDEDNVLSGSKLFSG